MLEILFWPFVACLVLTGIHCYLGIHVLMREVIFVDLALAQIAAVGVAAGTIIGITPHTTDSYLCALGFTTLGALVFALVRPAEKRVSQEAVIGIAYAVSSALMFIILSHTPVELEEIKHMLVGRLLFVGETEIGITAAVYVAVALVHVAFARPFFAISRGEIGGRSPMWVRGWDFVFYTSFGVVVASSVQIAGVLLVFSFLIVPAACASLFWNAVPLRLYAGWAFGTVGSVLGVYASWVFDLPTGASVVAAFGAMFAVCTLAAARRRRA